jgi:hypothetical protein
LVARQVRKATELDGAHDDAPLHALSSGFSRRKPAAVTINYLAYSFIKIHRTLGVSPAMAVGVTTRLFEVRSLRTGRSNPNRTKRRERQAAVRCLTNAPISSIAR